MIASQEFLAELDFTVAIMERGIMLGDARDKTRYGLAVQSADARLLEANFVHSGTDKFLASYSGLQFVFEVRNDSRLGYLEATYEGHGAPRIAGFLRPGCETKVNGSEVSIQLAYGRAYA